MNIWFLACETSGEIISSLTIAEVVEKLKKLPIDDLQYWYAWQNAFQEWLKVKTIPEIENYLFHIDRAKKATPPPLPFTVKLPDSPMPTALPIQDAVPIPVPAQTPAPVPTATPTIDDETIDDDGLTKMGTSPFAKPIVLPLNSPKADRPQKPSQSERRKHARKDLRLRAIVSNGKKAFRTFTENVSEGGVKMAQSLQGMDGKLEIFLSTSDSKEQIRFNIHLVGEKNESLRYSFVQADPKSLEQLKNWLSQQQNSETKKKAA